MRWPGYLSTSSEVKFADLPNGILGFAAIPPAGLLQIFLFCAAMEVATWPFYENVSKTWPPLLEGYAQPGKGESRNAHTSSHVTLTLTLT